jgi:uncharacterized protein (TIGR03435 family)
VGGRFFADFPLTTYITFAHKLSLTPEQMHSMVEHLPTWVARDRFEIEARSEGMPTKDQMRLMMQLLLADRSRLTVHFETQVAPVLAIVLVKSGRTGPKLRLHSESVPCEPTLPSDVPLARDGDVFQPCDVYMMTSYPTNCLKQALGQNCPWT